MWIRIGTFAEEDVAGGDTAVSSDSRGELSVVNAKETVFIEMGCVSLELSTDFKLYETLCLGMEGEPFMG